MKNLTAELVLTKFKFSFGLDRSLTSEMFIQTRFHKRSFLFQSEHVLKGFIPLLPVQRTRTSTHWSLIIRHLFKTLPTPEPFPRLGLIKPGIRISWTPSRVLKLPEAPWALTLIPQKQLAWTMPKLCSEWNPGRAQIPNRTERRIFY